MKHVWDIVQTFHLFFKETKDRLEELHQTIIDLLNSCFNSRLIGYNDIVNALKNIRVDDNRLERPTSLDSKDYEKLRKILKFGVIRGEEMLSVVFSLPLVQDNKMKAFRIHPIPEIVNKIGTFASPKNEIFLSTNHSRGIVRLEIDKKCKRISSKL